MKKVYNAPVVETLNCKVEKGFAGSNPQIPTSSIDPASNGGTNMGGAMDSGNANSMFS